MEPLIDTFPEIKPEKLYSQIVEQFVELIKRGEFEPGQRLPPERILSKKMNVSRTSLREALIALKMMGLVVIVPNQGTFISDKQIPPILKEVTYLNLGESPFEILQARKAFEPNMAAIAAAEGDEESFCKIGNILENVKHKINEERLNAGEYNDHDCAFHLSIAKATHNPILAGIGYIIHNLMKQDLWMTLIRDTTTSTQTMQETGFKDHEEIYLAIQSRNSQTALSAMRKHLTRVEKLAVDGEMNADVSSSGEILAKYIEQPVDRFLLNTKKTLVFKKEAK